jgi:hypothetical protein
LTKRTAILRGKLPKEAREKLVLVKSHEREGPTKPGPAEDLKLHHVGFVVSSIQDCAQSFALALGATWDGNIVFDPIQKVRVTFFGGAQQQRSLD